MGSNDTHVQSFARGLQVVTTFSAQQPRQTLSQVAEATGLARATVRRLLLTLVELGYAGTDRTTFWLTPRILELGYSYVSALQLPEIAQPHLEALSRAVGESSSMSVLDGSDIVYVARVPVSRILSLTITVGTRLPAEPTAMGRVLLGQSNEEGYVLVDQELEAGLRAVAAPVLDSSGTIIAAINIAASASTHSLAQLREVVAPAVLATAHAISTDLQTRKGTTP